MPKAAKSSSARVKAKSVVDASQHQDQLASGTKSSIKAKSYWLMKAEPESRLVNGHDVKFSIDDLKEEKTASWDGVRNYEARNNMKAMKPGDLAFFYHSNCKVPGIVGIMKVTKSAFADFTAFDKKHPYFDPKSDKENPKWFMVEVGYVEHLPRKVTLEEIKNCADLAEMSLLKRKRLSIVPVRESEWTKVLDMANTC